MKTWKIEHTNKSTEGVKIAIALSSSESKGIILNPGEFVLSQEQMTKSLDSQQRRGYVKSENFDNSNNKLNLGEIYKIEILKQANDVSKEQFLSKLEEAKKDTNDYINEK